MNDEKKKYFNYYCLDKLKDFDIEYPITNEDIIQLYNMALRTKIKGNDCIVLYNPERDGFIYSYNDDLSGQIDGYEQVISMSIYEFAGMMTFKNIYNNLKEDINDNWDIIGMDECIDYG